MICVTAVLHPQVHDKPSSSLLASSMVAMEITVNAIMRMDGCPGDLLEKVSCATELLLEQQVSKFLLRGVDSTPHLFAL